VSWAECEPAGAARQVGAGIGGSKPGGAPFPGGETVCAKIEEPIMDQRIVESPEQARQGRKYSVMRYVLLISTLLVVIAFAVAYTLSV
jgi:hypothetical protein